MCYAVAWLDKLISDQSKTLKVQHFWFTMSVNIVSEFQTKISFK